MSIGDHALGFGVDSEGRFVDVRNVAVGCERRWESVVEICDHVDRCLDDRCLDDARVQVFCQVHVKGLKQRKGKGRVECVEDQSTLRLCSRLA